MRAFLSYSNAITKMLGAESSLPIVTENKAKVLRKIGSSFLLIQTLLD